MDHKAQLDQRVPPVQVLGFRAQQDLRVRRVLRAQPDSPVQPVQQALRVRPAFKDRKVRRVRPAHKALQVLTGLPVLQAPLDHPARQEQVQQAQSGLPVQPALPD